jgi:hypothetical protein
MKKEKRKTCGPAFKTPPRPLFRTKQNKTSCLLGRKKKKDCARKRLPEHQEIKALIYNLSFFFLLLL